MSSVLSLRGFPSPPLPPLIGTSPAVQKARRQIERFATSGIPVLLVGPTGTGKELLARHLHSLSGRPGELVDVNCGALPREMIGSLLFGHRKGAFTGAVESTTGMITRADQGTLFLDELSSLASEGQATLLRVLETGEVLPLGSPSKLSVDVRVVAAVQDDIDQRVTDGSFRRDLFYRIAGLRIDLPFLAARREDIPLLAAHFAAGHGCTVAPDGLSLLEAMPWPGNVRELRALIERAVVWAQSRHLDSACLLEAIPEDRPGQPDGSPDTLSLLRICRAHGGRAEAIAAELGVSRATLFRRLRSAGISLGSLRVSRGLETR
jgi:DNA-binding NtrC family response regulator